MATAEGQLALCLRLGVPSRCPPYPRPGDSGPWNSEQVLFTCELHGAAQSQCDRQDWTGERPCIHFGSGHPGPLAASAGSVGASSEPCPSYPSCPSGTSGQGQPAEFCFPYFLRGFQGMSPSGVSTPTARSDGQALPMGRLRWGGQPTGRLRGGGLVLCRG